MFQVQGGTGIAYHENQTVETHAGIDRRAARKKAEHGRGSHERGPYILLRHRDIPDLDQLEVYRKNGGFDAFKKAVTSMSPPK